MTQDNCDCLATPSLANELLAIERAAMVRWCNGDPSGFLEISAEDVVYFDPFLPARLNGRQALANYYETLRGKIFAERFEFIAPHVQQIGRVAILTFNFVAYPKAQLEVRWNCTEVYRHEGDTWRIIQTHWSFAPAPSPMQT